MLVDIKTIAKDLDVSFTTVRRLVKDGEIPYLRIGRGRGCIKFDLEQIRQWLELKSHKVKSLGGDDEGGR
jgi:excisionase family DNA binding protein